MDSVRAAERRQAAAIGEELKRLRIRWGLTQEQATRRMPFSDMSVRVLGTYENGIRNCSVGRFLSVCEAYEADPADVMALAIQRGGLDIPTRFLLVNLVSVIGAQSEYPTWTKAITWAYGRLRETRDPMARMTHGEIARLAGTLEMTESALTEILSAFLPDCAPRVGDRNGERGGRLIGADREAAP